MRRAAQGSTGEPILNLGPRGSVTQNSYGPPILLVLSSCPPILLVFLSPYFHPPSLPILPCLLKRLPCFKGISPPITCCLSLVMDAASFQKELKCSCPLSSTDCSKCQQHHISPFDLPANVFELAGHTGHPSPDSAHSQLNYPPSQSSILNHPPSQTIFIILSFTHIVSSSHPTAFTATSKNAMPPAD